MRPSEKDTLCETQDTETAPDGDRAAPGLLLVFADGRPQLRTLRIDEGEARVGRGDVTPWGLVDERVSRQHARVAFRAGRFRVHDEASRNGTFVDGGRIDGTVDVEPGAVVRFGSAIALLARDVRPFEASAPAARGDGWIGPTTARVHARIAAIAAERRDVLIHGETGSGKELAARAFHAATGRGGPLVAVNCATIPESIAERILFGARKGTYSGAAADAPGLVASAHGGVLFLDEIAELPAPVQAKLLRFLQTREVIPLGSTQAQPVDAQICFASHGDLRAAVREGRFRADFYYRIREAEITLPPLRDRPEEIAWLLADAVASVDPSLALHPRAVEAALLHDWPGNVRELLADGREAASLARGEGATRVAVSHLRFARDAASNEASAPPRAGGEEAGRPAVIVPPEKVTREQLMDSLERNGGVQERVWRDLGLASRHVLTRLLKKHGVTVARDAG